MRGGKREGAGRPKGGIERSPLKRDIRKALQQEVIEKTKAAGITPLEVMTSLMLEYWKSGSAEAKEKAAFWADRCAPYFHAKLANVQHSGDAKNPIHQQTRVEMVVIDATHEFASTDDPMPGSETPRAPH
jgi:hypothetical protein